jgi:hypothetical protein
LFAKAHKNARTKLLDDRVVKGPTKLLKAIGILDQSFCPRGSYEDQIAAWRQSRVVSELSERMEHARLHTVSAGTSTLPALIGIGGPRRRRFTQNEIRVASNRRFGLAIRVSAWIETQDIEVGLPSERRSTRIKCLAGSIEKLWIDLRSECVNHSEFPINQSSL